MTLIIGILIVVLGLTGWACWRAVRAYLKSRGKRIVNCPETKEPAAVELAKWRIAMLAAFGEPALRLGDCSRWHEREPCDQACLPQIQASPEQCLVHSILSKWYEGKACSCCGEPIGRIGNWQHVPCAISPDLRISEWKNIPVDKIPLVLGSHAPVCWRCLVAETHIS